MRSSLAGMDAGETQPGRRDRRASGCREASPHRWAAASPLDHIDPERAQIERAERPVTVMGKLADPKCGRNIGGGSKMLGYRRDDLDKHEARRDR